MDTRTLFAAHIEEVLARTRRAMAEAGYNEIVLHAGTPVLYHADDQEIPFRPIPHFARFVPVTSPHHLLHITASNAHVIEVVPQDFWEEKGGEDDFWKSAYEVTTVGSAQEAQQLVGAGGNSAHIGGIENEPPELLKLLDENRAIKTPYEVACIEEANRTAAPGHAAARDAFLAGSSELEIHFAYLTGVGATERELPYPTIVGLNEKASILHYQRKRADVRDGKTFLIDAGAKHFGYASDITRTYAATTADQRFVSLLRGMDELQQTLVAAVMPDKHFIELHHEAHVGVAALLKAHGIIHIDGEEAVQKGLTRAFLPHGLGHMLGLQVHDVGNYTQDGAEHALRKLYPSIRTNRKLKEGMVTTIEPGLYFIEMLLKPHRSSDTSSLFNWNVVDELMPCGGIRIEDNVLVTAQGPKNLTRPHVP